MLQIFLNGFLSKIGTLASFAGKPTGMSKKAFSFFGRSKISSKKPIGDGV